MVILRDGFHVFDSEESYHRRATPLSAQPELRFNDGAVDPVGRAFGGTMPYVQAPNMACLYRLDAPGKAVPVVTGLGLSNGLGWSSDGRWMYLVDSAVNRVIRFAYDVQSGNPSDPQIFLDVPSAHGMPDGLFVDDDDCVWLALWDGGRCHRYTPDGRLDRVVSLPVSRPTSMCFHGSDLSTLVVTTARYGLSASDIEAQPLAGSLFAVDIGCTGPAATPWREKLSS